jgi:hypothetical protein
MTTHRSAYRVRRYGARFAGATVVVAAVLALQGGAAFASGWTIVSGATRGGGGYSDWLRGVTCTGASSCVAVGGSLPGSEYQRPLIETFNGTTWASVFGPMRASGAGLASMSCASPTHCVAVGNYLTGAALTSRTFAGTWNGTSFAVTPTPNHGGLDNSFESVSCAGPTTCVAVGFSTTSSGSYQTLIASWNGSAWSLVASPRPAAGFLNGVVCISSTNCQAVGYRSDASGVPHTLAESWDGTTWAITPAFSPSQGGNLIALSCSGPTQCVAVGKSGPWGSPWQPLVEAWNGSAWTAVASPSTPSGSSGELDGISCVSAVRCTAVGQISQPSASTAQTLIESWNGSAWIVVGSPSRDAMSGLRGVACNPVGMSCVAAGESYSPTTRISRTLVESGPA